MNNALEVSAFRFSLYVGHLNRAVVKERCIDEYFDYVRHAEPGTSEVVLMD